MIRFVLHDRQRLNSRPSFAANLNMSSNSPSSPIKNDSVPVSSNGKERTDLLAKARAFLRSPAVISQDVATWREFLKEKGLNSEDIEQLISESPPPIPPRTYPRPAPSKLPVILYATFKLLLLLTGASVISAAMYFTDIYPKLAATFGARAKLSAHQTGLLKDLYSSTDKTRQVQRESLLVKEKASEETEKKPLVLMEDNTAEMVLVTVTDETTAEAKPQGDSVLSPENEYDLLVQALKGLKSAIPRRKSAYNATVQDMTDMTALIASKMYAPKVHTPIEGEVRKELRAAKGLLLNRRTFTPVRSHTTSA